MDLDVKVKPVARRAHRQLGAGPSRRGTASATGCRTERASRASTSAKSSSSARDRSAMLRVRLARRDVRLVRIAREVRHERQRLAPRREHATTVRLLGVDDVAEERPAGCGPVLGRRVALRSRACETKVRRVDLAVRVRIADADHFALVLEHQHAAHFGPRRQVAMLRPEDASSRFTTSSCGSSASVRSWRGVKQTTRDSPSAGRDSIDAGRRRELASAPRARRTGDRCRTRRRRCTRRCGGSTRARCRGRDSRSGRTTAALAARRRPSRPATDDRCGATR